MVNLLQRLFGKKVELSFDAGRNFLANNGVDFNSLNFPRGSGVDIPFIYRQCFEIL